MCMYVYIYIYVAPALIIPGSISKGYYIVKRRFAELSAGRVRHQEGVAQAATTRAITMTMHTVSWSSPPTRGSV